MFLQLEVHEICTGIDDESSHKLPRYLYRSSALILMLRSKGQFEKLWGQVENKYWRPACFIYLPYMHE